jgi:hypothetical protein
MVMVFNRATGEYRVNVLADRAHPFAGDYRICINLYDRELGTALDPAFFSDVSDHFYVLSKDTSTMYILSGTNTRLKSWNIGNRVFTNSLTGTGNPDGCVVFRSTVTTNFGWGSGPVREDVIAYSQLAQPMVAARAPNPSWTVSKGLSESECRTIAGL